MQRRVRLAVSSLLAALGAFWCVSGLLRFNELLFDPYTLVKAPSNASNVHQMANHSGAKMYDRLVVVLIDALRADMVLGSDAMYEHYENADVQKHQELNTYVPQIRHLLTSHQAQAYIGYASVPTVTMPRLKALVTGKAPAFIDLLKNFNSAAMNEENIVQLLGEAGHNIVFYGDDTWLKLFPSAFTRTDATSGFFARDTVQVDNNVTRHLHEELDPSMLSSKSNDWDVLVLHYLGLDHVGHLRGPRSSMMKDKLHEMDDIVAQIYRDVQNQDAKRKEANDAALPSLILLCSDHGMSEVGNHGGATVEESSALLMFLRGDGRPLQSDTLTYNKKRMQVDIVPTLSALFGLRIPSHSTGRLIDDIILKSCDSQRQYLEALDANFQQLYSLATIKFHASSLTDFDDDYAEAIQALQKALAEEGGLDERMIASIRDACQELQNMVGQSDGSEYNEPLVFLGLFSIILAITISMSGSLKSFSISKEHKLFAVSLVAGCGIHVVSLSSSSSIENEHATSFFLLTTVLISAGISHIQERKGGASKVLGHIAVLLCTTRLLRARNQVINFGRLNDIQVDPQTPGSEFAADDSLSILSTAPLFHDIPDVVYYIVITVCLLWKEKMTKWSSQLSAGCFLLAMLLNGCCSYAAKAEAANNFDSTSVLILLDADAYARLVYLCILGMGIIMVISSISRREQVERMLWTVCCLVQSESNLPTMAVLAVHIVLTDHFLKLKTFTSATLPLLIVVMSHAAFFALGNSHLVTTVDISQSYHGLSGYSQGLVGLLTFFNVMTGPLLVFAFGAKWIQTTRDLSILFLYQSLRFVFYTFVVYLLRFHLFIWSVFAPKLLYELVHLTVTLVYLFLSVPSETN